MTPPGPAACRCAGIRCGKRGAFLLRLAPAMSDPLPGLQEAGGVSRAMTLGDAFGAAAREIWIGPVYLGR